MGSSASSLSKSSTARGAVEHFAAAAGTAPAALLEGKTALVTGANSGIGLETVKTHVHKLLRKMSMRDRTQAAVWAVKNGVV